MASSRPGAKSNRKSCGCRWGKRQHLPACWCHGSGESLLVPCLHFPTSKKKEKKMKKIPNKGIVWNFFQKLWAENQERFFFFCLIRRKLTSLQKFTFYRPKTLSRVTSSFHADPFKCHKLKKSVIICPNSFLSRVLRFDRAFM